MKTTTKRRPLLSFEAAAAALAREGFRPGLPPHAGAAAASADRTTTPVAVPPSVTTDVERRAR
jgi:hypothetical protein